MIKTTIAFIFLFGCATAHGQAIEKGHAQTAGQSVANDLEKQVSAAMATAMDTQSGDPVAALAAKGDAVLPYLMKYQHDPSPWIRSWTASAIMGVHTVAALPSVVSYLQDKNASPAALQALYCGYSSSQLRQYGGDPLKLNLISLLQKENTNGTAILLLSAYRSDPSVVHELKSLRNYATLVKTATAGAQKHQYPKGWTGQAPLSTGGDPSVLRVDFGLSPYEAPLTTAIDVSLAEMSDQAAAARVRTLIRRGSERDRLYILKAAPFVNGKLLVSELVELLRDKAVLKSQYGVMMPSTGPAPSMLRTASQEAAVNTNAGANERRICDLTLYTLARKTKVDVGVPDVTAGINESSQFGALRCGFPGNYRRYSDAELATAYLRLKTYVSRL